MKVQYIGRQAPHRERLYKTGLVFAGPGDVQEVPDNKVAQKMLNNHPDQYGPTSAKPADQAKPDAQPSDEPVIILNGETTPLNDMSQDVLVEVAKKYYETKIPARTSKPDTVTEVAKLIAQYGQPAS